MNKLDAPELLTNESLEAIRNALVDIQLDREQTASFLEEMFDAMESMRLQIESHETTLRTRRDQLGRREAQMRQTLEDLELRAVELSSCEEQLREARETIVELKDCIEAVELERDQARERLDAAADELASVAEVLSALDATQKELDETRRQLIELKEHSQQPTSSADEELLRNAVQEKQELENELKKSRDEVQRLNERVREQSDELVGFRKRWSGGLEQMRDTLMKRAKDLKDSELAVPAKAAPRQATRAEHAPRNPADEPEPIKPAEKVDTDSVIGSVLAQLADLEDE